MRVLIADRDARMLEAVARTFATHFSIAIATSKVDCLDLLEQSDYDVVITCEKLSDGSGLELLSQIARNWPDTLRIFAARPSRLKLLRGRLGPFGLFRTLTYPIDFRKLLAALSLALGSLEIGPPSDVRHVVLEGEVLDGEILEATPDKAPANGPGNGPGTSPGSRPDSVQTPAHARPQATANPEREQPERKAVVPLRTEELPPLPPSAYAPSPAQPLEDPNAGPVTVTAVRVLSRPAPATPKPAAAITSTIEVEMPVMVTAVRRVGPSQPVPGAPRAGAASGATVAPALPVPAAASARAAQAEAMEAAYGSGIRPAPIFPAAEHREASAPQAESDSAAETVSARRAERPDTTPPGAARQQAASARVAPQADANTVAAEVVPTRREPQRRAVQRAIAQNAAQERAAAARPSPSRTSSGNAPKRSPSQRVAFQRALAKRNAARQAAPVAPAGPQTAQQQPNTRKPSRRAAGANARPTERTPSLGSIAELARIAAAPRPAYLRQSISGSPNRTAFFVGAGVAAAVLAATLTFKWLNTNDSLAQTPAATQLRSQTEHAANPFAPQEPTLMGPAQRQTAFGSLQPSPASSNPPRPAASEQNVVVADTPAPTSFDPPAPPASQLPYEPPPTPPDFIPQVSQDD